MEVVRARTHYPIKMYWKVEVKLPNLGSKCRVSSQLQALPYLPWGKSFQYPLESRTEGRGRVASNPASYSRVSHVQICARRPALLTEVSSSVSSVPPYAASRLKPVPLDARTLKRPTE
jgi:hypothetical protein